MRHYLRTAAVCLFFLTLVPGITTAQEGIDRHEGYYYPETKSEETYVARAVTLPQASRQSRIGFVTGMTAQQLRAPYPPQFAIFAKGDDAQNSSSWGSTSRPSAPSTEPARYWPNSPRRCAPPNFFKKWA